MPDLLEATIDDVGSRLRRGDLSCRELTEWYLDRIERLDRSGPAINCVISLNPAALDDAGALGRELAAGNDRGPLHGVPILIKDQIDVAGLPTTLGSVLFEDFRPDHDAAVVARLRAAGMLVLGKTTLGELGGGDTHGTLFGSTRNPYRLDRTPGGSSGGSAAAVTANLAMVALGQEGLASIRRPAAWTCSVGMRPTAGLVSRTGVFGGWPSVAGGVGPMTRTVRDAALLLDAIVGFDPADPLTATGVGHAPASYANLLEQDGLRGRRIGVIRDPMGLHSEPESGDFGQVTAAFDEALAGLARAGATLVDPVHIPGLATVWTKRHWPHASESFENWIGRSSRRPFDSYADLTNHAEYAQVIQRRTGGHSRVPASHLDYLLARDELRTSMLSAMAVNELDAVVHKSVEHSPTLIVDASRPPFVNQRGAIALNTFIGDVPAISVPAPFTADGLPTGITFVGRPFTDARMLSYAAAYEAATQYRVLPECAASGRS